MNSIEMFILQINEMYHGAMLSDVDIAKILGVHKETIYRMRKKGTGPNFIKIGRKSMCIKKDFFDWFFAKYSKINVEGDTVKSE